MWDALGRQVAGRNYPPTNKNTLIRALTEEWDKLPQQLLDNVVQTVYIGDPLIMRSVFDSYPLFRSFEYVGHKVLEWKECQPAMRKTNLKGHTQNQSYSLINIPSIWLTRLGNVVDVSHDGLFSQLTNDVGIMAEDAGCRPVSWTNTLLTKRCVIPLETQK
ncbi:hypothetical protein TNCV_1223231 [Trichonephila clavipes]|nr:hypothetical protein TNCV_1223231 [Trichonephila clavipes]